MSEIQWTKGQIEAITARDARILVSAAAGSGKTTVLTERIIRRLCDQEDPIDLDQMLIVTFTKAATADLKEQIASALTKASASAPSPRLTRQLSALPTAQISTIHSFCFGLIKANFQKLRLPPSLRIAEENENRLLALSVMDRLLGDLYDGDESISIPDFALLVDQFVTVDDQDFATLLLSVFDRLVSLPDGIALLRRSAITYREEEARPFLHSLWGDILTTRIMDAMGYFESILKGACAYLETDDAARKKFGDAFHYCLDAAGRMHALCKDCDFAQMAALTSAFKPPAIRSTVYENPPLCILDGREALDQMKTYMEALKTKGYFEGGADTGESAMLSARIIEAMADLLEEFDQRFAKEKRRRGMIDFADLERMTLSLLRDRSGAPTPLATAVSSRYREIYSDEYQDVNEVQDAIFSAISVRCARFMVGDIKQSIYAFRGSAPHLFARYRRDPAFRVIFLSENFRSDKPIIDFSNAIFDVLFRHSGPDMPYEDSDSLVCGKRPETQADYPCELALLKMPARGSEEEDPEPSFVASRIKALIETEGYAPDDIVILLHSPASNAQEYEKALSALAIGCVNKDKESLFENEEVLLLFSLLRVIDNPRRDIDLAAVLRSPLFGMDMNELILIREEGQGCLYEALKQYTEAHKDEKGRYFFEKLKEYREMAIASPVDRLIWDLIEDTGIAAFKIREDAAYSDTPHANLTMFYEYARQFESGSFQGLSAFIRYLSGILDSKGHGKFPSPETADQSAGSVRIMSIHASKGLQFPVTFVCETGKNIDDRDAMGNLLLDARLGVSMKLSDDGGLAGYDTPYRLCASAAIHDKTVEEEMRLLYVALTRAKQRLIVTGAVSNPDKLRQSAACAARNMGKGTRFPFTFGTASYMRLILIGLAASGYGSYLLHTSTDSANAMPRAALPVSKKEEARGEGERTLLEAIKARYDYVYPHAALSLLPAKVTVSRLNPSMLDETDGLDLSTPLPTDFETPLFLAGEQIKGSDRGTATHLFMQFCDLSAMEKRTTQEEAQRLVESGFLTKEIADLINHAAIRRFFVSPLYREMRSAKELCREVRFNTTFPASAFSQDDETKNALDKEKILVQGVMDCYFIDRTDRLILIDYKTDRIPEELRSDEGACDAFLANRHCKQLRYYRTALERMLMRRVDQVKLWSFALGREVDLTLLCASSEE